MKASVDAKAGSNRFVSTYAAICSPRDAGEPRAIYFHLDDIAALLLERINNGKLLFKSAVTSARNRVGSLSIEVTTDRVEQVIRSIIKTLSDVELSPHPHKQGHWDLVTEVGTTRKRLGVLKLSEKKFLLHLARLRNYIFEDSSKNYEGLTAALSKSNCFSLNFADPSFFYMAPVTMRDDRFRDQAKSLFNHIETLDTLSNVTSEKGIQSLNGEFSQNSIFGVWDQMSRGKANSLLVCDDGQTEWADFIHFEGGSDSNLEFVHMKHSDLTSGASDFHVVISQAIKNLGELFRSSDHYVDRLTSRWRRLTVLDCNRIRALDGFASEEECIGQIIRSRRLRRTVSVVVNFMSRSAFVDAIEADEECADHIVQKVWLLSTFVYACHERGVTPRIICSS
jgi:hypothetical protein